MSAYFSEGRCSGHHQFNGRYCRDSAGPEQWCIHCEGFMLQQQLQEAQRQTAALRAALVWLGYWRDSLPTEAVTALQDILAAGTETP